ncbi:MAG: hypothetical protein ACYC7D_00625 [Nitrososphaerales archaeon]
MGDRKKKGRSSAEHGDAFRNRLDDSRLLRIINKIYKKEYGYSARKYLLTCVPRPQADRMLRTLELAPPSITKMFKRRLEGKYRKDEWTPMIPFPAVRKKGDKKPFVEEVSHSHGFMVDFAKLAGEGRLLYTAIKPSEFLAYAYDGELIEKRSDDGVPSTELSVKRKEKRLSEGKPLKTPYLKLDLARCGFIMHDGRHRVVAADERGVKEIPVMIEHQIPSGRSESSCLRNKSQWRKEDVSSPNLDASQSV